ncbi:outer-membrane lipoprotein carrier protein LolA [bacterium]|nr:outer-membrane lipoprotein carrier protein LolA [bacterium]
MKKQTVMVAALVGMMLAGSGVGKKVTVVPTPVITPQATVVVSAVKPEKPVQQQHGDGKAAARLAAAQEALAELTADFALVVPKAGKDGATFTAQGKMWVAAGRRYIVAYEQPEKQRLVSNGSKRWLYLEKINQVQIQSLPPAGNPNEFFLELGGGLPALIKQCDVQELPKDRKHPEWEGFVLIPKSGTSLGFSQVKMWLAGKQLLPRRVVVMSQRKVRVDFSNVKVHTLDELLREPEKGLDAGLFTFEIPQGAEVIEMF